MVDQIRINEHLSVGNVHPDAAGLEELARQGFKAIVNLRTRGEKNQPLSPEEEAEKVRALGMAYLRYPVTSDNLSEAVVDEFRRQIADLPRPLFVHCASGMRSGAFVMMHVAAETGMSGEETLARAEEMGFTCGSEKLEGFVRRYVDAHRERA